MRTYAALGVATAALFLGCALAPRPGSSPTAGPQETQSPAPQAEAGSIALCDQVQAATAPAAWYRDSPIYVANEQPTEQLRTWASGKPGFEMLWIDREHNGWVVLAFSLDAETRQRELEAEFPDVGVVAVPVEWTAAELEALQQRVIDELMPGIASSAGSGTNKGVVSIGVGVLTPERIAAVEERFAGERVCLEGFDPALVPPEGPQQQAGDGWRILADEDRAGDSYRTGIAFDEPSYAELWRAAGMRGDGPAVDFETEVVIWFGAVHGSSCPNLRLDDVVVERDRALVFADIVLLDAFGACTADAIPHAYVVALQRSKLPAGPFAIQLSAEDPPAGVPEERTVVDVDLSKPGATAAPSQVHADPKLLEPHDYLGPGDFLEPGFEMTYRQSAHCGVEWLGPLNEYNWQTEVRDGGVDYIPREWRNSVVDGNIELELLLTTDPKPTIEAIANGHSVIYQVSTDQPPGCD